MILVIEEVRRMGEDLTFEDGILICRHIYQNVIDKTLNGVIEQDEIFYKTHELLSEIDKGFSHERLEELLFKLNMENVSTKI
jgi:hypothetical protein